jgi:hypothetical protein
VSSFAEFSEITTTKSTVLSLSALGGGEGRGEMGARPGHNRCGFAHLTLPIANATGPLPLPPQSGGEGRTLRLLDGPSR